MSSGVFERANAYSANDQRELAVDVEVRGDRVVGRGLWFGSNAKKIDDMGRGWVLNWRKNQVGN
jgi:hypothetical protein